MTETGPGSRDGPDLVLYVTPDSPASLRARRTLEALLDGLGVGRARLQVRDVSEDPQKAEEDRVVFTPVLIVRTPGVEARAIGDLADAAAVASVLNMGGLETTR